jgi:hypothetical protein
LNSLAVLDDACENRRFALEVFYLGGILTIVDQMCFDHLGIGESCAILKKLLYFHRAQRVIRRGGRLVQLVNEQQIQTRLIVKQLI